MDLLFCMQRKDVRHLYQRQRSHQRLRESVRVDLRVRLVVPHTGRGAHLERNKRLPTCCSTAISACEPASDPFGHARGGGAHLGIRVDMPVVEAHTRVDMPVVEAHTWGSGLTLLLRSCAMLLSSMSLHPERQLDAYGRDMWRHFGAQLAGCVFRDIWTGLQSGRICASLGLVHIAMVKGVNGHQAPARGDVAAQSSRSWQSPYSSGLVLGDSCCQWLVGFPRSSFPAAVILHVNWSHACLD